MAGKTDGYAWKNTDVDSEQHRLLDELLREVDFGNYYRDDVIKATDARKKIMAQGKAENRLMVLTLLKRISILDCRAADIRKRAKDKYNPHFEPGWQDTWAPRQILHQALVELLRRKLPLTTEDLAALLAWVLSHRENREQGRFVGLGRHWLPLAGVVQAAEVLARESALPAPVPAQLELLRRGIVEAHPDAADRKLAERIEQILGLAPEVRIEPGEAWADRALADLNAMAPEAYAKWGALIGHCRSATGGKPSARWRKQAAALVRDLGRDELEARLLTWFPLVDRPRTAVIEQWSEWEPNPNLMIGPVHLDVLKGLVWCCSPASRELARTLTDLALSAYKKVPGTGPRAVKLGNACVYTLGQLEGMDGVDQLAVLKVRVKFKTAQQGIANALAQTAERLGISAEELEEMGVPAYGMTEVGARVESLGAYTAELRVAGSSATTLTWASPGDNGKAKRQKSIPAAVKRDHADDLKELKAAGKDIQKMLSAQRDRIDNLFLHQKSWPYSKWKERYLDHPLVGVLARRLIWRFGDGANPRDGIYLDGTLVDSADRPVEGLGADTTVRLWHPLDSNAADIITWREWLERNQVTQPFKQAHREIYILTDAERHTSVYSNRFAAHVVRQHQFNALCAVRGWRSTLQLMVDDQFPPPSILLPAYSIRAEFWTNGIGEDYGVDTNETGTYHYLTTDQVRFHDTSEAGEAEPMRLEDVPPLVLSEIFRDVDLFVGVASVGNDPNWNDGGPDGRYRDYWHSYSFGDLGATAKTRKEILERLVPRLKIADRCSFTDKFLVVRGDIRTYKIHLGSANILMTPNDQYLCIVPSRGKASAGSDKVFLPFEGDTTMSLILSKAFLLAADTKISDQTILSQLQS